MKALKLFTLFFTFLLLFTATITFAQPGQLIINDSNYNPGGCYPQTIKFTVIDSGATNYSWNFNDGSGPINTNHDTISHTFTKGGNFWANVSVFDTTQFIGGSNMNINIGGTVNMNVSTDSACVGETVYFGVWANNGSTSNYKWNFDDPGSGSNNISISNQPQHIFSTAGTYNVRLICNTQCGVDTITQSIYVNNNAKPYAGFYFRNESCPFDKASFNANDQGATSFKWNFGDPASGMNDSASGNNNISHSYSVIGKYAVTLTVTNSCGHTNSHVDTIWIVNNLRINSNDYDLGIYTDEGSQDFNRCPGDIIDFYSDNFDSYLWKFGDGDSSTNSQPSYVYDTAGVYILSLKVTNGCGYDTTIFQTVTIGEQVGFGGDPQINTSQYACPNDLIHYGYDNNGQSSATSYLWHFGDGITSTLPEPTHSYTTTGVKNVSLQITNNCGNDTIIYTVINISDTIKPYLSHDQNNNSNWGASVTSACVGDSIFVYAMGGASYLFDFGDGFTTTNTTPLFIPGMGTIDVVYHAYQSLGTYKLKLTYYNHCGNSAKDSMYISIGGSQPVNGSLGVINNDPIYSCQTVSFVGFGGANYIWYFGDGDTLATGATIVEHNYSSAGTYHDSLKVINGCGNSATYYRDVTILTFPAPVITKVGDTLYTSSETSYQWYLNNVLIPGAENIFYLPTTSGKYSVVITNANGCTDTSLQFQDCFVKAGSNLSVCTGGSVQLNASGADTYSWTPASTLSNANIANPVATPADTTQYIVTGTAGTCVATDTVTVFTVNTLTADAGPDKIICKGMSTVLEGSGGGDYAWAPSASLSTSNVANPTATPTTTTTYTLTVSSGACVSTATVMITVKGLPTLSVMNDTSVCKGSGITLSATSNGSYFWSTGDTTATTTVYPTNNTTYYITATGSNSCIATGDVQVNVNIPVIPVISLINFDSLVSTAAVSYQWYEDGTIIPGENSYFYIPVDDGSYTVETVDNNGCSAISDSYYYNGIITGILPSGGSQNRVMIYPNPAKDILNISVSGISNAGLDMDMVNVNSQLVYRNHFTGSDIEQIDISTLTKGVYFIKIKGNDFVKVFKVIKY
jgi:PKD repeat protein